MQIAKAMDTMKQAWELFVQVRDYYRRVRKVAPWLTLTLMRNVVLLHLFSRRFILPKLGGYTGALRSARVGGQVVMGIVYGEDKAEKVAAVVDVVAAKLWAVVNDKRFGMVAAAVIALVVREAIAALGRVGGKQVV